MTARKPSQSKSLADTTRADRPTVSIERLPALEHAPECPAWLTTNPHAMAEWKRLARILTNAGRLTEGGLSSLGLLCALNAKTIQLFAAGETPTAHMISQCRALANDFGLTPMSEERNPPKGNAAPAESDATNPFAKY